MTTYDYDVAKRVLSETDKDRFLCCYLNISDTHAVNWEKAANDYGSASVQSFKKMIQNAFKKVKDGEAAGGDEGTGDSKVKEGKKKTTTPGSRKKKAKAEGAEQDVEESPTKKQKVAAGARKKKGENAAAGSSTAAGEQDEGKDGDTKAPARGVKEEIRTEPNSMLRRKEKRRYGSDKSSFTEFQTSKQDDSNLSCTGGEDNHYNTATLLNTTMATFTDGEAKLLMCMLKHLKDGNLNTDFEAVAAELGYKDASVAKTRWGQIKKKKIEGSTTDPSPVKATPKKRKGKASDGADDEETPKAKKGRGKAKSADVVKEDSEEGASAIETTEKDVMETTEKDEDVDGKDELA
ncbi:hypothetical protein KC332_g9783 [Hortaea werneckii]|nr:hypothetical protein KC358_g9695 [Hortaea werneckii]KAI6824952.1 hypothetical protein KC350_g8900 [Hortaea werneckii]KAI6922258.1 hypothetical protein KC348_g9850 [Hortaea werneckii]KAI6931611.1 hypothetical protein KC341_g9495 [Hortaea werneckii]KAI6966085.1 hypothetical protein KC321_g9756 [Hortaea werneckii]